MNVHSLFTLYSKTSRILKSEKGEQPLRRKEEHIMFKLIPYRKNPITRTQDVFDDFFDSFFNDDFFAPIRTLDSRFGGFKVDVADKGDRYVIEADLPGMERDNVKIEYTNGYLTISASRDETHEVNEENYIRRERQSGEYRRSFHIDNIQPEQIDATFRNGVLRVELVKKQLEPDSVKRIEIKD